MCNFLLMWKAVSSGAGAPKSNSQTWKHCLEKKSSLSFPCNHPCSCSFKPSGTTNTWLLKIPRKSLLAWIFEGVRCGRQWEEQLNLELATSEGWTGRRTHDLRNTWVIIPISLPWIHPQIHPSTLSVWFEIKKKKLRVEDEFDVLLDLPWGRAGQSSSAGKSSLSSQDQGVAP